jgi:hypothetical protein
MGTGGIMARRPTIQPLVGQEVEGEETDSVRSAEGEMAKHYHIILRIRHPELDPAEITAALGWQPHRSWQAGDRSTTPKGTKLAGLRSDGLWSYTFRYKSDEHIADKFDHILAQLIVHKDLFEELDRIGAQSALYLQLPGDTNIGDRIPWDVLKKFVDLKIAFELETFPQWG